MYRFMLILVVCLLCLAACGQPDQPTTAVSSTTTPTDAPPTIPPASPTATLPPTAMPLAAADLIGQWLGVITWDEKPLTLRLTAEAVNDGITARISIPQATPPLAAANVPLTLGAESLEFAAAFGRTGTYTFSSQWDGEILTGTVTNAAATGTFQLVRTPAIDEWEPYTSMFQFDSGRVIDISPSPGELAPGSLFLPGLWFVDFSTGDYRTLTPVSETEFLVGAALGLALPPLARLTFIPDANGQFTTLQWQPFSASKSPELAERLNFPATDVTFTSSDGVALAGTLTLPAGEAPFPAIVLVHGSGPITRQLQARLAHFLLTQGFAVLNYDKRGVGESGGRYNQSATSSMLTQLAEDAAAGIAYLHEQPEIDGAHLGLYGGSQAGWIIPIAAATAPFVSFAVILSGPVVTVGQEGTYSALTGDGAIVPTLSEAEIADRLAGTANVGFDPLPYIGQLDIPVIWLFGGNDLSVPIPTSIANLNTLIEAGAKSNFTYHLFPDGDHGLWESENGLMTDWTYVTRAVPGYYDTLRAWLADIRNS